MYTARRDCLIPLPVMRMSQSVEGRGGLSVKAIVGVWERVWDEVWERVWE